jgi:hypothetical protein
MRSEEGKAAREQGSGERSTSLQREADAGGVTRSRPPPVGERGREAGAARGFLGENLTILTLNVSAK